MGKGKGKKGGGRGGIRQRLAREQAELDDELEEAAGAHGNDRQLATALLYLWSLGTLSPQVLQTACRNCSQRHPFD